MTLFEPLYTRVLGWAQHPRAPWYLGSLSFAESTFFPVPPDVMLIPMTLARPDRGWRFAALCTVTSVVGGMFGYLIGMVAFDFIEPVLRDAGYWGAYESARDYFERWGFWFVLVAGFSPIPYKIFTITAGVLGMPFVPFVFGSALGRGGRFFLVVGLIRVGGERMEQAIRRNIEILGWATVVIILALVLYLWMR